MKKFLSKFLVLTMIMSLFVGFVQVSAADYTLTLGAPATAETGTQFNLNFTASGLSGDNAGSVWVIQVSYDNTKVSPVKYTSGANNGKAIFTSTIYGSTAITITEPPTTGNTSYIGLVLDGDELFDTTLLGTIVFNAIAAGDPAITVVNSASSATDFSFNDHTITGANPTMTITAPAPTLYDVTVTGGTATPTSAASGTSVSITAGTPPTGQQFKNWTSSDVTFADSTSATTTFTMPANAVAVTANYEDIPVTLSTNANLSDLTVTDVTFNETFSSNLLSYTATVANSVDSISINATKDDATATVTGDGIKSLSVGPNSFDVVVTAEDTSVVKTYVVTITREAPAVEGSTVEVGDVSGYVGQNVIVPITFTDMTALNNFDVRISYETSKLEYVGVTKGALVTETPSVNTLTTGSIGISGLTVAHGLAGLAGDVVIANATFKVIDAEAGSSIVSVVAGRYNSSDIPNTNFVNGTVTYTLATDPLLTAATSAVEDYEAVVATTIAQIDSALAIEKVAAEDAVALVVASESQEAKLALEGRITAKTNELNAEKTALEAEAAATLLVAAYEDAPITTLAEVTLAEGKGTDAYTAVTDLRIGSVKTALLGRLAAQDIIVAAQRTALTKAAALAAINAGTATIAEYQLIAPLATETLLANYNRGVVAGGSDLTESEVVALVEQVNTPTAPVITTVTIVGQAVTGSELSVTYDYYDANFDLDAGQTTVWTVLDGTPATQATYTVVTADVAKTITVSVAGVPSSASLPVIRRGDVTMDGSIYSDDAFDLREVFHNTGTFTAQQKEAADANNDGTVNALDLADVLMASEI